MLLEPERGVYGVCVVKVAQFQFQISSLRGAMRGHGNTLGHEVNCWEHYMGHFLWQR